MLRWGVIGTGNIANQFAMGVLGAARSRLEAVGSRSSESAHDFAQKYQVAHAHGSYEALLADAAVDAVYLSLPNSMHHEWALKALRAGKHVLCEKPFATDAAQAQEMFDTAQQQGLVLVEAFMYRSHPQTHAVLDVVRRGMIGRLKLVRTSFCYCTRNTTTNVRFSRELAGGGLMDVGCYCIDFSKLVAGGEPVSVSATGVLHESGVDELVAATMNFGDGVVAEFVCGMTVQTDNAALVCGDGGYVRIPVPWKPPVRGASFTLAQMTPPRMDRDKAAPPTSVEHTADADRPLYALEADEFAATVLDGAAPAVTPAQTLSTMRILDAMRRQVGVVF